MIELFGVQLSRLPDRRGLSEVLDEELYTAWRERHKSIRDERSARVSLGGILLLQLCAPKGNLMYDDGGRPYFENSELDFNITHTDQSVFCVIERPSREGKSSSTDGSDTERDQSPSASPFSCCSPFVGRARVGLDAEDLERIANIRICPMAARWFSEREYALFSAAPTDETFLRVWTRKEALIKWTGEGLNGLHKTDTALAESTLGIRFYEYRIGSTLLTLCCHAEAQPPSEVHMLSNSELSQVGLSYL